MYDDEKRPYHSVDVELQSDRPVDGSVNHAWRVRRSSQWRKNARPVSWLLLLMLGALVLWARSGGDDTAGSRRAWRPFSAASRQVSVRTDGTYAYAVPIAAGRAAYEEHPVHGLIREAKRAWAEKVARQSQTYEQAVAEYQRRYRRPPPPGFDKWYEWATEHDVQLIDEFDTLADQIEPFYALRPSLLHERIAFYEDDRPRGHDHSVVTIQDGLMTVSGGNWRPPVPDGFILLMKSLGSLLPNVKVPLYLHDASSITLDAEAMEGYRRAARLGEWVKEDELPIAGQTLSIYPSPVPERKPADAAPENSWTNRERQCAPDSPFRRATAGLALSPAPGGPPFVHNHLNAMSYCMDPSIVDIHGATSGWPFPQVLRPSFALSRARWNGDIVWPSTIQYNLNPKNESAFREKAHTLLWRGSPDGIGIDNGSKWVWSFFIRTILKETDSYVACRWRQSHRFRLINLLNSNEAVPRTVRETRLDRSGQEYQIDVEHTLADLNERYSNVRATGGPVQCAREICEHIKKTMHFAKHATLEEMADNRYVMDVDGNAYVFLLRLLFCFCD